METSPSFYAACLENFYSVIRNGVLEIHPKRKGALPISWEVFETVFDEVSAVLIENPQISFPITLSAAATQPNASYGVKLAFKALKTQVAPDIFEIKSPPMIVEVIWPKIFGSLEDIKEFVSSYVNAAPEMFDDEHGAAYLPLHMITISYTRN